MTLGSSVMANARNAQPTLYLDSKNAYYTFPACRQVGLHRDNILAKVPGPCPVQRQVTPTNVIDGPLAGIYHAVITAASQDGGLHEAYMIIVYKNNILFLY
jgi:hypothetical protein